MTDFVNLELDGRVLTATINRPEAKNALTHDMYDALADALDRLNQSDDIKVLVITGTGDAFTSGNDVGDFASGMPQGKAPVVRFLENLRDSEKPVMAAVNGLAVGVGVTMLQHCDLSFAGESGTFSAPFAKVGLVPEAGSSMLLPFSLGMAWANDLLLTGRNLSAQEALMSGMVSRVFADEDLHEETMKVAHNLAGLAPNAVKQTKRLVRMNREEVSQRMMDEGVIFREQLQSHEFTESVTAMMEKRAPNF